MTKFASSLLLLFLAAACLDSRAQKSPDAHSLLDELNRAVTLDRATEQIAQLAQVDKDARKYFADRMPSMIDKPGTGPVWLNAVRLAGQLKVAGAVPALIQALPRGPVGGPVYGDIEVFMRLDNDVVGKALSEIGDPAAVPVSEVLAHGDKKNARRRAALILLNMNSDLCMKILREDLPREKDQAIRYWIETKLPAAEPRTCARFPKSPDCMGHKKYDMNMLLPEGSP
jgi:hypothetical protein